MPRKFGKGMMIMHAFGTGTASDQAVSVASATFRGGLSGIWYQWLWLFVTPFYWLIPPIFRRFRAVTAADVYELRFDRSVAVLFSLVGMANMCVKIGLMLKSPPKKVRLFSFIGEGSVETGLGGVIFGNDGWVDYRGDQDEASYDFVHLLRQCLDVGVNGPKPGTENEQDEEVSITYVCTSCGREEPPGCHRISARQRGCSVGSLSLHPVPRRR